MIVFMEKIALPPTTVDEEAVRKLAERLVEDRWVKNLIDSLAGILRDVKR